MPVHVAVVAIEGVLGRPSRTEPANVMQMMPIEPGQAVLKALRRVGAIVLVTDYSDRVKVEHWLRRAATIDARDYEKLYVREHKDSGMDAVSLRLIHLNRVRALPLPINLFVDSNPSVISRALGQGLPCLYFLHPSYARAEHRPGEAQPPKPWDEVVAEVAEQRELIATDPRRDNP